MTTPPIVEPTAPDIFWTFAGPIDQAAVQRVSAQIPPMMNAPANAQVHLCFQSGGGVIGDGVWLFNFIRNFPRKLTIYNTGNVGSIGVIAFLGGAKRIASAYATFMIHRSAYNAQPATATNLAVATKILQIEDARTEAILKANTKLTDSHWQHLAHHDLWLSSDEALELGIIHEIGEFVVPKGERLFAF